MTKILNNERGFAVNLALAMVLVAVAISAMVSLINLNIDDRNTVTWQQDRLQQELLIRSESGRIIYLQGKDIFTNRRVEIVGRDRIATHTLNYRNPPTQMVSDPSFLGELSQAYQISAMCVTRHSRINAPVSINPRSPVQTYFEKLTRRSSLAQYQYFTDREISDITNDPNDPAAIVRFDGNDELFGRVHSNENIVISNLNGWPKFHDYVTTAGEMRQFLNGEDIPLPPEHKNNTNIFVKGVKEWVAPIVYTPDADLIRKNGTRFGGDADIVLATIDRGSFSTELGFINNPGVPEELVVYHTYPDALHPFLPNPPWDEITNPFSLSTITNQNQLSLVGDSLWTNYVTFYDTTWTIGSSYPVINTSYYTNGNLWVIGELEGKLTLSSRKNSYILGNITYRGTDNGQCPDGFRPNNNTYDPAGVNSSDYFGLVSESSIIIKYKWRKPNANGDMETFGGPPPPQQSIPSTNHGEMYLYGAYSAQGGPDPELLNYAWKAEGVFTFEYQHPGSSPLPFNGFRYKRTAPGSSIAEPMDYVSVYDPITNEEIQRIATPVRIDWIDLHRYKYPPDPPVTGTPPPYSWRRWPGYKEEQTQNLGPYIVYYSSGVTFENRLHAPWYSAYDYPWYNPVYPEQINWVSWANNIRGTINLYGSIAQRRRGFIRRSGVVRADNPDQNHWVDLGDFNPYGPVHFTGGNYVYGGVHRATGYNRNYYFDRRFYWEQPPHYPEVYTGAGANRMTSFDETTWNFKVPPRNWIYSSY